MSVSPKRVKAIKLRRKGLSYSQINEQLGVSKSTLSGWLKDMPLSEAKIKELRANSEQRIERYKNTMKEKRDKRRLSVLKKVQEDFNKRNKDVEFISGFYLYWGEGTKTATYTVSLTNSDPSLVRSFVLWIESLGVQRASMRVKLHLYSDQDEKRLKYFWSKNLGISIKNFNKSYIKKTDVQRKTYKGMFPYGTCVVAYHDRDMREYVMAGIEYLRNLYRLPENLR